MQRTQRFNNCGLSSSVYQTCYPDSLTNNARRASVCSIQTLEPVEPADNHHHHSEKLGRYGESKEVTFYIGSSNTAAYEEDDACGQESEDCGSSYEEECHFGLQKLLSQSLKDNMLALFHSNFGAETSVLGISDILPSVITQLLHLSEDEPYGVRGANVILVLDRCTSSSKSSSRKSSVMSTTSSGCSRSGFHSDAQNHHHAEPNESDVLGTIKLSYETVTTFELILTLREGRNLAVSIRNWMANVFRSKQLVMVEPNFTLHKRKLYRS